MKKIFFLLLFLFFLSGLAAVGVGYYWFNSNLKPVSSSTDQTTFEIKPDETGYIILQRLESAQLIRSSLAARIYLRLKGSSLKFVPGIYSVSPNRALSEQLQGLTSGPVDIKITFPEGWRREQYVARLSASLSGPTAKFSPTEFLTLTQNLEGQLFPDTYNIPATATAADVVKIMTSNFSKKTGLTLPQDSDILILASLIERESKIPAERPTVAGILYNRLEAGWALGIDATVQYAKDSANLPPKYWEPIFDTKYPSIYNTYLNPGLPPTPICNPGLSSIEAAKNPVSSNYMFYLHGNDGVIRFARTLEEHNQNVDKYLSP